MDGALVLVVGASGAGKDTLIGAAKAVLAGDSRFVFPRRVVTRTAMVELEDHDSVTPQAFAEQRKAGAYALDWEAHGLCYGVPAAIDSEIEAGRVVVVNVSRRVIGAAAARHPRCHVLVVTARPEVRAARLGARGRESEAEISARLEREGAEVAPGPRVHEIDNSGSLAAGVAGFVGALREIAGA